MNKRHRTYIPEKLILDAIEEDYVRDLAFFVKLKAGVSHGSFSDIRSAAKRTSTPRSTAGRHISNLIKVGLITKKNKRYILLTRKQIDKLFEVRKRETFIHCCTILHQTNNTLTEIEYLLRHKLTEYFNRQQKYHTRKFTLIESQRSGVLNAVKSFNKEGGYEQAKARRVDQLKHEILLTTTGFTYEWLANQNQTSKGKAHKVMQYAKKKELCKARTYFVPISAMSEQQWLATKDQIREFYPTAIYRKKEQECVYNVCTLFFGKHYWKAKPTQAKQKGFALQSIV